MRGFKSTGSRESSVPDDTDIYPIFDFELNGNNIIIATENNNPTSNRYRSDSAALSAWGIRQGVYEGFHPIIGIEPLPKDPATRYMQPETDIAAVRVAARVDERDFTECIYLLAARRGEVIRVA